MLFSLFVHCTIQNQITVSSKMMTTITQLISSAEGKFVFPSKVEIPFKFEIPLAESLVLFGCGFVTYGILYRLFKKIKNVQLERELRSEKALRIKDEERYEKQLEYQTECYRILRQMDSRKISKAEYRCNELIKAYRALEEQQTELEQQRIGLEEQCQELKKQNRDLEEHITTLEEQFNELDEKYKNVVKIDEETNSASLDSASLDDDQSILSEEIELEIKEEVQVQPHMERRLWSNREKADGTYAHQLPDGFQAYLKSCKQTMSLTFQKGESKEDDRWIINGTGDAYWSLNQARAAFFGDVLKTKQSVWLSVRSTEDGRSLRNVIEG
jgi:hypothetical protein